MSMKRTFSTLRRVSDHHNWSIHLCTHRNHRSRRISIWEWNIHSHSQYSWSLSVWASKSEIWNSHLSPQHRLEWSNLFGSIENASFCMESSVSLSIGKLGAIYQYFNTIDIHSFIDGRTKCKGWTDAWYCMSAAYCFYNA